MNRHVVLVAGHGEMGGGEVMLLACAKACAALGLHPVVVAPEAPATVATAASAAGYEVCTHSVPRSGSWLATVRSVRRAVRKARRGSTRTPVWCHGLRPIAATAGMPARIIHVHRGPSRAQQAALVASAAGVSRVLVPSLATQSSLPRALSVRARILGNWTDDIPRETSRTRSPADVPVVGYLGRLAPEKGIPDLILALQLLEKQSRMPPPLLAVGGTPLFVDDSAASLVEREITRLGARVSRRGWVERSEFLETVDVLVCPSTWAEPFGLVVAEAMAARVPVVVSDAGALPEVVGAEHPYTARAGDPASLAYVLHRALGELGTPAGDAAVAHARRRWETLWSPAAGRERVAALLTGLGVLP